MRVNKSSSSLECSYIVCQNIRPSVPEVHCNDACVCGVCVGDRERRHENAMYLSQHKQVAGGDFKGHFVICKTVISHILCVCVCVTFPLVLALSSSLTLSFLFPLPLNASFSRF